MRDRMLIDMLRLTKPEDLQMLMQLVAPKKPKLGKLENKKPDMYKGNMYGVL